VCCELRQVVAGGANREPYGVGFLHPPARFDVVDAYEDVVGERHKRVASVLGKEHLDAADPEATGRDTFDLLHLAAASRVPSLAGFGQQGDFAPKAASIVLQRRGLRSRSGVVRRVARAGIRGFEAATLALAFQTR
jgi:hypothetical protein